MISPAVAAHNTLDASALLARLAAREQRIELLEGEIRWLKSRLFGRSSEKSPAADASPNQQWLFNEVEALAAASVARSATVAIPAHERKKRGRKKLPASLPRIEVIHDLSEAQKICPTDGTTLERIGQQTSEQLQIIPAQIRVIRHIRPQYACPCCRTGIKIAPAPLALFPKSIATASLLAQIATAKFVDGTPLYRQQPQFGRLGIRLGRATMAGWMIRLGHYLVPLINLLNEILLAEPVLHCDETRLQVLKSDKSPTADHWMWVRSAGPPGQRIVLFDYDPSRGGAVPQRLLEDFHGVLVTDGYAVYDGVAAARGLTHAGCMAHARRKFDETCKASRDSTNSQAQTALQFIAELSRIEQPLWDPKQSFTAAQRIEVRQTHSAPIMAQFHTWLEALAPCVLPESRLGKAIYYTLGQWPKLCVFLTHGDVPMHNNRCENAIRPFVIGRKGWLFSDTVNGATASACLYSLIETAKANGVEPHAYLTHVFERLPYAHTVEHFEALLPWNTRTSAAH